MRDYQLKGYNWMATLYENGINGKLSTQRFCAIFLIFNGDKIFSIKTNVNLYSSIYRHIGR